MAFAYQRILERVSVQWVSHFVRRHDVKNIALAGGVAANVKNNQRIYEIEGVQSVFVQPAMGDDGAGLGAALARAEELGTLSMQPLTVPYFGPEFSTAEIKSALDCRSLKYHRPECIEDEVAQLLAQGEIVARFDGRLEYGPRALGNRSILCQATDARINATLNAKLHRTEFMPFAPMTLLDEASRCYLNTAGITHALRFMTITVECTEFMKTRCPAAVHVDGTARPQLVSEAVNPSCFRILNRYHELTGIPTVINTSFNMHEEPIVCSPEDAIRGFLEGQLDNLAIGPFLVRFTENRTLASFPETSDARAELPASHDPDLSF